MSLKQVHHGSSWNQWDEDIAVRQPQAMAKWGAELADEIYFHKFVQYQFFCQWQNLKQYTNQKGIKIFGDIPIYVAHDSVDVWAHKDIFCLDGRRASRLFQRNGAVVGQSCLRLARTTKNRL